MNRLIVKGFWWKYLGVLLILYSIIAGLTVPLGPGITEVNPDNAEAGKDILLEVKGYNSHFSESDDSFKAWLKLSDEYVIAMNSCEVLSRQDLRIEFSIPGSSPFDEQVLPLTLVLYNDVDGSSVLPNAIFISDNRKSSENAHGWESASVLLGLSEGAKLRFPYRNILVETIRNTYFHVPLWMAMMAILFISMVKSISYLRGGTITSDNAAVSFASTGLLFGILGIITGSIWARNTWGAYWSFDVKQNTATIALLVYAAYFVLRHSISDKDLARKVSAGYNVFAFIPLIPLLYIIPRMTASLHPGSGGNPAMGGEDLDNTMRLVFYPAVIGWFLIGVWISTLHSRFLTVKEKMELDT
jgi:heme exporter protein C